jgi:hypothetical protein
LASHTRRQYCPNYLDVQWEWKFIKWLILSDEVHFMLGLKFMEISRSKNVICNLLGWSFMEYLFPQPKAKLKMLYFQGGFLRSILLKLLCCMIC